jgi:hypothetical protein
MTTPSFDDHDAWDLIAHKVILLSKIDWASRCQDHVPGLDLNDKSPRSWNTQFLPFALMALDRPPPYLNKHLTAREADAIATALARIYDARIKGD